MVGEGLPSTDFVSSAPQAMDGRTASTMTSCSRCVLSNDAVISQQVQSRRYSFPLRFDTSARQSRTGGGNDLVGEFPVLKTFRPRMCKRIPIRESRLPYATR